MRSGHFNHQRHAQQTAEFFARIEAERQAMRRERVIGSFDNMEFDRNMPLAFTTVPATDESDDEQPEADDAADYSWTHDRS